MGYSYASKADFANWMNGFPRVGKYLGIGRPWQGDFWHFIVDWWWESVTESTCINTFTLLLGLIETGSQVKYLSSFGELLWWWWANTEKKCAT